MEPIKSQNDQGGGGKNSKVGGWIYYLNNSKELVLIALHILCDGKTTVLFQKEGEGANRAELGPNERHIGKFLWWMEGGRRGRGGNICLGYVRLIILKFRCIGLNSFFIKTKVEIKHSCRFTYFPQNGD